jgi:phosphatidylinositol glycan class W
MARIIATSAVDYQHHAGEYGVHWNFFMTLAGLRILHSAFYYYLSTAVSSSSSLHRRHYRAIFPSLVIGIATLTVYQYILSKYKLIEYIHSDDRDVSSIISANKEGIFSLIGYWSLHLLGIAIGTFIQTTTDDDDDSNNRNSNSRITRQITTAKQRRVVKIDEKRLWMVDVVLWIVYACISTWIQPVSRRACNTAYVVWMLALNVLCLGGFITVERKSNTSNGGSVLLQAICGGLLPVFLVANVLTGVVNMSSDTLSAEKSTAVAVVMVYMALVCLGALGMMKIV